MLNKRRGVTATIIMEAQSLNYNESLLTISELKKVVRGDGSIHTYASRQCMGYEVRKLGGEVFDWDLNVVTCKNRVMQFDPKKTIKDSVEMDLFGYMMTAEGKGNTKTRNAVVRLSPAFSLEPYRGDLEFGNNMGLAKRTGDDTMPFNIEQHKSYYAYTFTIDLNKVGIDGDIELDNAIKYKRLCDFLDIVRHLSRDIRGRRENLSPIFCIGGVYTNANAYFDNRVSLVATKDGFDLNTKKLNSVLKGRELGRDNRLIERTVVGRLEGVFNNIDDLKVSLKDTEGNVTETGANIVDIDDFFDSLKADIKAIYEVK